MKDRQPRDQPPHGRTGTVRQRLGALILIAVILVVTTATLWSDDDPPQPTPIPTPIPTPVPNLTVIKGYGGELKVNFLSDPEVAVILADRYGLRVDIAKRGSIELACGIELGPDNDFVWLGDSVALERYRERGCTMLRYDNIYNSPIVLYSWAPIVDALVAQGVARDEGGGAYSVDFALLAEMIEQGQTWTDLRLPQLHGRISVHTTDPARSNSGFLFAGLLANTLNGGNVVNPTTVQPLLPVIHDIFARLGYMQGTSGDLFEQFLITGMGAMPIVALYESQVMEFLHENPSYQTQVSQQVRMLYPRPTVWASHPFAARTDNGIRLLEALKDPDIQRLAWERHGQRPGVPGVVINPNATPVPGILPQITSVTNMPAPGVMDQIIAAITTRPIVATTAPLPSPPDPPATPSE